MEILTVEQQRARIQNLDEARQKVKDCLFVHRLYNYEPGNVTYFLGEYPLGFSCAPTEYDYETLKKYAELGISIIKVHEEWNDSIRVLGADKYTSHDPEGFRKFLDLAHSFGLKVLPYFSSGYIHYKDPEFRPEFVGHERFCSGQYFKYHSCSLKSPEWRNFVMTKAMQIMDEYDVDGLYNDHPPEMMLYLNKLELQKTGKTIPPEEMPYDPYDEDLFAQLYHAVKRRGGTYILHLMENYRPITNERIYDYLYVGEGLSSGTELLKSKTYMPHIINNADKKSQTMFGRDYPFALAIPYLQYPRLNHGRRLMRDKTTADVQWYDVDEKSLYHFWKRAANYAQAHPNGPYTHGEFSAIPDPDDLVEHYGEFLKLYLPMVTDDTVVHVELHTTTLLRDPVVPKDIIISLFSNEKQYLTITNTQKTPWQAVMTDIWQDRKTGAKSNVFTVPPEEIIFLER